jgi:hypothetical protein
VTARRGNPLKRPTQKKVYHFSRQFFPSRNDRRGLTFPSAGYRLKKGNLPNMINGNCAIFPPSLSVNHRRRERGGDVLA